MLNNGKKPSKEQQKVIDAHNLKMQQRQFENALLDTMVRARSIVVGTAFGGTSEISIRRPDGTVTYVLLQPVEVVELIHQMAASVGCHIHLQPRQDFSSWRTWNRSGEELSHFRSSQAATGGGHPPHQREHPVADFKTSLPSPEQQPGLQSCLMTKDKQNETVATEKLKNRRNTKRTAAAA